MDSNESEIRAIIENWARAVREKDMAGILANHANDIVMFDVPPPFALIGISEYQQSWQTYYDWALNSGVYDITDLNVFVSEDVAFGFAVMKCAGYDDAGKELPLEFRMTVGLVKVDGQWLIKHEHHSVPIDD